MNSDAISPPSLPEYELEGATAAELLQIRDHLAQIEFFDDQTRARDLKSFAHAAWEVLEPATALKWNWHLDLLAEYLQLVRAGQITRLIINVPPQTMKSRFASIFFPCWWWLTDPSRRFMCVSYSGGSLGLAGQHSRERRRVLESDWFQSITPQPFNWTQSTEMQYENDAGGRMIATSPGGTATGKGVHCILMDDLVSARSAESEAERSAAIRFIDQTLRTRLSDQVTGAMVVIEQRLHERDVTGHVLSKEPGVWTHVSLPMVAEKDEEIVFPISGRIVKRAVGDLLIPDRFPQPVIDSLRLSGTRFFSAQYQQRPTPAEGIIFNPGNWRYYVRDSLKATDEYLPAPRFELVGMSVDCSFKDAIDSDNVAIHVYGASGPRNYLLERNTCPRGYAATKAAVKAMKAIYPQCSVCLIEDKANGSAVIEELRRTSIGMSIVAVEPNGGKTARAWAAQPDQEVGNCYLADDDPSTPLFVEDMAKFRGEGSIPHDDDVDAFTQWVNWRRMHSFGFFDWARERAEEIERRKDQPGPPAPTDAESNMSPEEIEKKNTQSGMVTAIGTGGSVGRVFGGTVNKVSFSGLTKPATNEKTPKCPDCGNVNLSRTEDARGNKIISCGACGWKNTK